MDNASLTLRELFVVNHTILTQLAWDFKVIITLICCVTALILWKVFDSDRGMQEFEIRVQIRLEELERRTPSTRPRRTGTARPSRKIQQKTLTTR
ncbi:hypothetical protein H2200_004778 [Cladophialophora chaetospira]|uniref:Uncharacterized protein n=1 Tax=Cladophialophora chaetospira TaxID=386627 RepID=A0AA38XEE4_9EURO|nr:hypothetical protein H2200_004778 [Cladophialophora chaetospira]